MPTSSVFRRARLAAAIGATTVAVAAGLMTAPAAQARPVAAPSIGGGSEILGAGCFYPVGIKTAPDAPTKPKPGQTAEEAEKAEEAKDKAKKDKSGDWVTFWDVQSPGEPGQKGSVLIGRAKPNAQGVAVIRWTPRRTGFRSIYAKHRGQWSQPRQITVNEAISLGRLCILRFW